MYDFGAPLNFSSYASTPLNGFAANSISYPTTPAFNTVSSPLNPNSVNQSYSSATPFDADGYITGYPPASYSMQTQPKHSNDFLNSQYFGTEGREAKTFEDFPSFHVKAQQRSRSQPYAPIALQQNRNDSSFPVNSHFNSAAPNSYGRSAFPGASFDQRCENVSDCDGAAVTRATAKKDNNNRWIFAWMEQLECDGPPPFDPYDPLYIANTPHSYYYGNSRNFPTQSNIIWSHMPSISCSEYSAPPPSSMAWGMLKKDFSGYSSNFFAPQQQQKSVTSAVAWGMSPATDFSSYAPTSLTQQASAIGGPPTWGKPANDFSPSFASQSLPNQQACSPYAFYPTTFF